MALLVLAVVLFAAWAGWRAYQVQGNLRDAISDATALQNAIDTDDDIRSQAALTQLQEDSRLAADRTSGPTWGVLSHLPRIGDDAAGIATVSDVVSDLSRTGLEPLTDSADVIQQLLPRHSQVDLTRLAGLDQPLATSLTAFDTADQRLADVDASGFVGPLRSRYDDVADRVDSVTHSLRAANVALDVMPTLLGGEGRRHYLLVFQNNAEVRATGGLPGAISLLGARAGKVDLTTQTSAGAFPETSKPVLPLTTDELRIYSAQLGTQARDANFTPDFPRTAALLKAHWQRRYPGRIDGVISVDPVALSYILAANGPVRVDDVTLTSANVVDAMLHGVYLKYPEPADQDAAFQAVARTVFDTLANGAKSPQKLISAFARGVAEHRIYVWSDRSEQARLAGTEIAGGLPTRAGDDPQVGVYLNDATGAKMSYYLRYDASVRATGCTSGVQQLRATLDLASLAPKDSATSLPAYVTGAGEYGVPAGHQVVAINLFGPVGGTLTDVSIDGKKLTAPDDEQAGRPVATVYAELRPQDHQTLTWSMRAGPGQSGHVDVDVTPGVTPESTSSVVPSAC